MTRKRVLYIIGLVAAAAEVLVSLRITIDLDEADLKRYRGILREAAQRGAKKDESQIIAEARAILARANPASRPSFLTERFQDVETLLAMLEDTEWGIAGVDRERVITAVTYFAEPLDLIPDSVPGVGFLDDAVMVELIVRELRDEIEGYRDFGRFREQQKALGQADVDREKWIKQKRRDMFARIKRRRAERRRHHSTAPLILRTK